MLMNDFSEWTYPMIYLLLPRRRARQLGLGSPSVPRLQARGHTVILPGDFPWTDPAAGVREWAGRGFVAVSTA